MKPNQFENLLPQEGSLTSVGANKIKVETSDFKSDAICFSDISENNGAAHKFVLSMISIPKGAQQMKIENGKVVPNGDKSTSCVRGLLVSFPHLNSSKPVFDFEQVSNHFCEH
jgi:hypothetical protein